MTAATLRRRRLPVAVPIAIALAWAAAVAAHATGVAGRFHHDALLAGDVPSLLGVVGYALSWTVMVTAMMLPSAVPLLRLFVETSAGHGRRGRLLACFAAGYLAVWLVFGWAALIFDGGVHQTVDALGWLAASPELDAPMAAAEDRAMSAAEIAKVRAIYNLDQPIHQRRGRPGPSPIHASAREAAHLREVFNAGESAATPVIAMGVVLAVVAPLAAILILLDFGVAHFW